MTSLHVPPDGWTVDDLSKAGTHEQFRAATHGVPRRRLADGTVPSVDYAHRRHALRGLRSVPAEILHNAAPSVATASRRRCSAAWLWAHLTGGHPHEAPACPTGSTSTLEITVRDAEREGQRAVASVGEILRV